MSKKYDAIKEGAKEAIFEATSQASDLPGQDTFEETKTGVREATLEWLNNHSDEFLKTFIVEYFGLLGCYSWRLNE